MVFAIIWLDLKFILSKPLSVSYTHLDVYKRQVLHTTEFNLQIIQNDLLNSIYETYLEIQRI